MKFRGLIYGLVLLALLCAFRAWGQQEGSGTPKNQPEAERRFALYTEALRHLTIHGDTASARRLTTEVLALDSTYAPAHYLRSRIATTYTEAFESAEKAIESDSNNLFYLHEAGMAAVRVNRIEKAIGYYSRLASQATDPDHYRVLAMLYTMSSRDNEAIAALDTAEVRFGRIGFFTRMRQRLLLKNGQIERAEREALRAVTEAPYDAENHTALAQIYASTGRDSLATNAYTKALEIDKSNPQTILEFAEFLLHRQRNIEFMMAIQSFVELRDVDIATKLEIVEKIVGDKGFVRNNLLLIEPLLARMAELYPDNIEVLDLYAAHLVATNKIDKAGQIFKQRMAVDGPNKEALGRIIEIEQYLDRRDSVAHYIDLGIGLYPNDIEMRLRKAWLQHSAEDYDGVVATLHEALTHTSDPKEQSSIWGQIGDTEELRNNIKQSHRAYAKALTLNPDNAVALNNYAYKLAVAGKRLAEAEKMALRAIEIEKNNATYLDTVAWVYYRLGNYQQAKRYMQQALSFDKHNSAELALHYGDILDALGDTFLAQTYWKKALERGCEAQKIEQRIEAQRQRTAPAQTPKKRK